MLVLLIEVIELYYQYCGHRGIIFMSPNFLEDAFYKRFICYAKRHVKKKIKKRHFQLGN